METDTPTRSTPSHLLVGVDVGSTTAKIVVLDAQSRTILHERYCRHQSEQLRCVASLMSEAYALFPDASVRCAIAGSGGTVVAERLGLPFIQEVVANVRAIASKHPFARCAIELGGQDAKMVWLSTDANGAVVASDMRMNGTCAGGTGAFLDEMALLLDVPIEDFDALAAEGRTLYDISGRCGVFAKTDIQPLLNRGVSKADIALSVFHAIAKQTIGGLAQGLSVEAPVVFGGGPFTFNPHLVDVFAAQLELPSDQVIVPVNSELMVALGAALFAADHEEAALDLAADELERALSKRPDEQRAHKEAFFADAQECADYRARHRLRSFPEVKAAAGGVLPVYVGIDAGSTTTKVVLLDEAGDPIDGIYRANGGEPLTTAQQELCTLHARYEARGIQLQVLSAGATGYGEHMVARAFHCDSSGVETVAHARAAQKYLPEVSFILDIGGQDMKAIWMSDGVITDIVMNEACSSGCGSFLENFAVSLGFQVEDIADMAFSSVSPADLGSRCTVFMNSRIVSEQRAGKSREDIVAGLCSSIIENAFTKVIRSTNMNRLGDAIMVQGGTFRNDAVLCAFERYVGREVHRAPYPGFMGAIGAALIAREEAAARETTAPEATAQPTDGTRVAATAQPTDGTWTTATAQPTDRPRAASSFISWEALAQFSFTRCPDTPCQKCSNHCMLSRLTFSDGSSWTTGNRCALGAQDDHPEAETNVPAGRNTDSGSATNVLALREKLLFQRWSHSWVREPNGISIGIPRVLQFWDDAPFWRVLFESLGFKVVFSHPSSQAIYEKGLAFIPSDTICFPAKLVHGHLRDLAEQHVDIIFMPAISMMPPAGQSPAAESVCPVVKGYPFVMKNSDNPERELGIRFENPLFCWPSSADKERQIERYLGDAFGIDTSAARKALVQAKRAQKKFRRTLQEAGERVLQQVERAGSYAVVIASRPYQNDRMVNHDIPRMFNDMGVSVLPPDALPNINRVNLSRSRLDVANGFHERMLASAVLAAHNPHLEYVQLVSFGCGHDAYLSDEIVRMMHEISGDVPLILKIDESPAEGSLRIRVRSFAATVAQRRRVRVNGKLSHSRSLPDPYPVKFTSADAKTKTILVPNTSHAFSRLMATVFGRQGVRAVPLELGGEEAIYLGKRYVHNDICFPAQMVVGEVLAALRSGCYDLKNTAVGMAKYIGDCRLTHYSALLRKALDDAGFTQVPIVTNDTADDHKLHPGFSLKLSSAVEIAFALPMIDALEELLRKMRPYERVAGSANAAFEDALDTLLAGLRDKGLSGLTSAFAGSIKRMADVAYDRTKLRSRVLIVGEYLLNFHPGANRHIEQYLEKHGFEIVEARMTDVIRKSYYSRHRQNSEYHLHRLPRTKATMALSDWFFELAHNTCDAIASQHPLYEPPCRLPELARATDDIIPHTFDAGEGVLIPAEIAHQAARGCRAFVILQPFGCLPNHIVGRGIVRQLKERYPTSQILSLDYDPDSSFANVENRLQMLIAGMKADAAVCTPAHQKG